MSTELDAALALAQSGDFSGTRAILNGLKSSDRETRLTAAYYCKRIGFPAALAPLTRMAKNEPDDHVRGQSILALSGIGVLSAIPVLIATLEDEELERRQDARAALYNILGSEILSVLTDEEGGEDRDDAEPEKVREWWSAHGEAFDADKVYLGGELASPAVLIKRLERAGMAVPDEILNTLNDWTGENFGGQPLAQVRTKWKKWWSANSAHYEAGRRYFYGRPVPADPR